MSNSHRYWKLKCEAGRQRWYFKSPWKTRDDGVEEPVFKKPDDPLLLEQLDRDFSFDKRENPNSSDLIYRKQAMDCTDAIVEEFNSADGTVRHSIKKGLAFYKCLQYEDGHWPGDYGGPLFLLPGLIIASHITETPFRATHITLMKRYMLNHQNDDGGWGLHIEGDSTMFGTVMQYVALRLLGLSNDELPLIKARHWIHSNGGATYIPPWGKFYLSLLGVYEWDGCDTLLPELWLLPKWLPIHPWRYWCHARMVYLPMSYCYGVRLRGEVNEMVKLIRSELYPDSYKTIRWKKARRRIAKTDLYHRPSRLLRFFTRIMNSYESMAPGRWRKKAIKFIYSYIQAEDEQTKYVDIGPVNQVINSICAWHAEGRESEAFKQHVERWYDYLWVAEDGMKMSGYNGSQLWDTAFATQAIVECGGKELVPDTLRRAYQYIERTQVREEVNDREKFFRHPSKGAWPFSTIDHGWPISDCTAEAISAVLAIQGSGLNLGDLEKVDESRLREGIDIILSFQNKDGGWATYENTRGPKWLEKLNPSGIYGKIMIDYSWTECTSACIRALHGFRDRHPGYRKQDIANAIEKGTRFLLHRQRDDGSWVGSWAICFTYGTWFGVEGLRAAIESGVLKATAPAKEAMRKASRFLQSKQNPDGGWGESYLSCVEQEYVNLEPSQVVQTAWALLALMESPEPSTACVMRGIEFLQSMQHHNGDWPQQRISGVFNNNCMITYTAYRNVFPLWALGRYERYNNGR